MPAKLARRTPNRPQTLNMSVTMDLAGGEDDEDDQDRDDQDDQDDQDEGAFVVKRAFEVI